MGEFRKIGLIGIGPRGGYALESLILKLIERNSLSQIHFMLFEHTGNFGNGHVYNTQQTNDNWINLPERNLRLDGRKQVNHGELNIPQFPSYHEWSGINMNEWDNRETDSYPPRAKVGAYLQQRFQSFVNPLLKLNLVSLIEEQVEDISLSSNNKISIKTGKKTYEAIDEALLTIGHQPTKLSEQILEWEKFAASNQTLSLFKSPYPVSDYLEHEKLTESSTIGIRGFGLTTIDIARAIALKFGSFVKVDEQNQALKYETSHNLKDLLIPFSLDGLPPAPKPLNAKVDKWFAPSEDQLKKFRSIIGNPTIQHEATGPDFLLNAFAPIATTVFKNLVRTVDHSTYTQEAVEEVIIQWLKDNNYQHPILLNQKQPVVDIMQNFVGMASGLEPITMDYCAGQVWRHCQSSIYEKLSFNQCSDDVFTEIIKLNESTKRYSFGPPVESIQQLIALINAEVLNVDVIKDPEFKLTEEGWQMSSNGKSITVNMMIDSVLASPKVKEVSTTLVQNMLSNELIEPVNDDLGIVTKENGYVISQSGKHLPIALLGRLAKGTVIGVDAISECFGEQPERWAAQAAENHAQWLTTSAN